MEMNNSDFVFQTDSKIVQKMFEKDNYLVVYDETCEDKNSCAIYFSSNDIYFPNTEEVFRKRIVEKDFYEMYLTRVNGAYKHVFVRDIQKQWYIGGINSRIHSPELLLEFLQEETRGYSLTTIGSSAGGYAAVLYGSLLSANRVFSFNGQFEVSSLLKISTPAVDPLLFRNAASPLAKYFDIRELINPSINIYYFSSLDSEWDSQQYRHIQDITYVKPILFKTSHHGVPFVKSALPVVINMESQALDKMVGKRFNPVFFSIKRAGLIKTLKVLYAQLISKLAKSKNERNFGR
jgi:hypothetical protein